MALEKKIFQPGDYLFRENEVSFFFFFIDKGEVQIAKTSAGTEIPLAILGPGSPVGEFSMIDKKPRSASAIAKTTVVASLVSETDYRAILADLPHWSISMMNSLVDRLRQINEVLVANGLLTEELKAQIESASQGGNLNAVLPMKLAK
jgi:CRP/FNR family cyclic AMP-dependent transcriptional regulator